MLADSGEDALVYSTGSDYAANMEKAMAITTDERGAASENCTSLETPDVHTIAELAAFAKVDETRCLKTLLVKGADEAHPVVALVLRGDHELNEIKASNLPEVAQPFEMADVDMIRRVAACEPGSIGPVGLKPLVVKTEGDDGATAESAQQEILVIADHSAAVMSDFICGANEDGKHLIGVNWGRDLPEPDVRDLRNVVKGDPDPTGAAGTLDIVRGIEVGHIFQLGDTYSAPLGASVLDEGGRPQNLMMGCYGIGITRIAAAAIEQRSDEKGIVWPDAIAPFEAVVSPIHMAKSDAVKETAEALYQELLAAGVDVLFDDRPLRPGVMFADMELLGIPHRFVVSDKLLADNQIEYKGRTDTDARLIGRNEALSVLVNDD